jgi:uncharacterized protein YhaN
MNPNEQEQFEELQKQQRRLRKHQRLLDVALEGVRLADERIKRQFLPRLNEEFTRIAGEIIGGQERRVEIDDEARVHVIGRRTRPVESFSFGTVEQIYLSLRFGLARLVSDGGEEFPLLLDEPFAAADSERLEAAMELLISWGRDSTQIVLFTCDERILETAKEIEGKPPHVTKL